MTGQSSRDLNEPPEQTSRTTQKIAGCSITRQAQMLGTSRPFWRSPKRKEAVPEPTKLIERIVVGLVASAISINILAAELPRLIPYLIVLAVIFVVIRLVFFHTRKW
jgi:hypothetical protein